VPLGGFDLRGGKERVHQRCKEGGRCCCKPKKRENGGKNDELGSLPCPKKRTLKGGSTKYLKRGPLSPKIKKKGESEKEAPSPEGKAFFSKKEGSLCNEEEGGMTFGENFDFEGKGGKGGENRGIHRSPCKGGGRREAAVSPF